MLFRSGDEKVYMIAKKGEPERSGVELNRNGWTVREDVDALTDAESPFGISGIESVGCVIV
jgi:hypothetical protein